ncbi:MAG: hypothetical protein QXI39_03550 [Candidatus Bathyarchaeia archaeon]
MLEKFPDHDHGTQAQRTRLRGFPYWRMPKYGAGWIIKDVIACRPSLTANDQLQTQVVCTRDTKARLYPSYASQRTLWPQLKVGLYC